MSSPIHFRHIRNATAKITFGAKRFLLDPIFAEKGTWPGFAGSVNEHHRNPMVELPVSIPEILAGIDAVIVTHTHADHWDAAAQQQIPKTLPVIAQNLADMQVIQSQGFSDVRQMERGHVYEGVTLTSTMGQHGTDEMFADQAVARRLGRAMGVVLTAPGSQTVYFAGDTTWQPEVEAVIDEFRPDIIVLNTGFARFSRFDGALIMGKDDVLRACKAAPYANIIAVHMEAINHCVLGRAELKEFVLGHGIHEQVFIPADGETLVF